MPKQSMTTDTECDLMIDEEYADAPYFTDETAFLHAVFANWAYFIRFLVGKYPYLFEREREIGNNAPLGGGWYVPVIVPRAERKFHAAIGRCDAEDILMEAIERCTHDPSLQSFYANYQPNYAGKRVSFTTWFMSVLRSRAGLKVKTWSRRNRKEIHQAGPARTERPDKDPETVTAFFRRNVGPVEGPDYPGSNASEDCEDTHNFSNVVEAQYDVEQLAACLTNEERSILAVFLAYDGHTSKEFAAAIWYGYDQARNKMSYICKKMRKSVKESYLCMAHHENNID